MSPSTNTLTRYLAVACTLLTLVISWRLWLPDPSFPLVPAFEALPVLTDPGSLIVLALLGLALVWFGYRPGSIGFIILVLLFALLLQTDINRLQPTYYIFILILFCLADKKNSEILLILLFAGIYFWSGAHKYNDYFLEKWLGGLDKRIGFIPRFFRIAFTYAVPFIEAGAGILLLWPKTRRTGCVILVLMHLIIIGTLIKETGGYNVMPLNGLMISVLLLVIFRSQASVSAPSNFKKSILITLVWLLPVLNLFGLYDHFLSFSIMSGKPYYGMIWFKEEKMLDSIPSEARPFVRQNGQKHYILLAEWAGTTKKIMVYPETRIYKKLHYYLAGTTAVDTNKIALIEYRP